jgi:hypothetical protein
MCVTGREMDRLVEGGIIIVLNGPLIVWWNEGWVVNETGKVQVATGQCRNLHSVNSFTTQTVQNFLYMLVWCFKFHFVVENYWNVQYHFSEPREEPSIEYEQMRRKISNGVQEMWYFISGELKKMQKQAVALSPQLATRITRVLEEGVVHKRYIISNKAKCMCDYCTLGSWSSDSSSMSFHPPERHRSLKFK